MHQNHLHTGIEFARAVAKHFKLPDTTDADMELITGANEVFGVKVKLMLTADDLAGIADHIDGRTPPASSEEVQGLTFSAWMRDRTEAAHQAMMAEARKGGKAYGQVGFVRAASGGEHFLRTRSDAAAA